MPSEHRVHFVDANGVRHRVFEWSPPQSPSAPRATATATALLLHGFMDAGATWDLVAPHLAGAGLRVLAPDLRGFGESGRIGAGGYYHFPDYVFDVADLVDALVAPAPLFLVGHSMGGTVSTMYAGTFPERVTKLALLEGIGPPDNSFELAPLRARRWIDEVRATRARPAERVMPSREDALRRLKANHAGVPEDVLANRLPHLARDLPDLPEGGVAWAHDPLHRTTSPTPFYARALVEFAKRITCPVLFVDGGPLGFHPADEDERIAAFAHAERALLSDAGHMMHWTRPQELARALLAFWRGS